MTLKKVLVPGPLHPITLEPTGARVTVTLGGRVIADTTDAITLREASYHSLQVGDDLVPAAAWYYPEPHEAVAPVKDHVAFYPDKVDRIEVHRAA